MKDNDKIFCFFLDLSFYSICIFTICWFFSFVCNFVSSFLSDIKEEFNKKYYYVDFEGNKGEARSCDRNMSCVILEDKRILVKEWYRE